MQSIIASLLLLKSARKQRIYTTMITVAKATEKRSLVPHSKVGLLIRLKTNVLLTVISSFNS